MTVGINTRARLPMGHHARRDGGRAGLRWRRSVGRAAHFSLIVMDGLGNPLQTVEEVVAFVTRCGLLAHKKWLPREGGRATMARLISRAVWMRGARGIHAGTTEPSCAVAGP